MSSRWWLRLLAAAIIVTVISVSCDEPLGPDELPAADSLDVMPLSKSSVRVAWQVIDHPDVTGYRLERRVNFEGEFEILPSEVDQPLAGQRGPGHKVVFIDNDLKPETFYGYRVRVISRFGGMGEASIVRAAQTAPEPGFQVAIASRLANAKAADTDGYVVRASGPNGSAVNGNIEPDGIRRFNPLSEGEYTVWLTGLAPQCAVDGANERTATVADSGINTIDSLSYGIQCRDPDFGTVVVGVDVRGDSLASTYRIELTSEDALPDSVVTRNIGVPTTPGRHVQYAGQPFENLRPGTYTVRLSDALASQCDQLVNGEEVDPADGAQQLSVSPLSLDTLLFEVRCLKPFVDTSDRPIVMRNAFSQESARPGSKIVMSVTLDTSKEPDHLTYAIDWNTRYDETILRVDSVRPELFSGLTVLPNWQEGGVVLFSSFAIVPIESGVHKLANYYMTVVGEQGQFMRTSTAYTEFIGRDELRVPSSMLGAEEGEFEVGAATGSNQAPTAVASANPTSVGINDDVVFTGDQSSDPDGTIVAHEWDFGDGETSTQANPTHQYTETGTFTATLTVTDDDDATDTDEIQITVSVPGPAAALASVSPKIVGTTVSFDGSGSSGFGSLTYDWDFAGVEALDAGPTPSHIFKTLGQKTVTLTVTDGNSMTDEAQIMVHVIGPSADAGEDRNVFKDSVVTYDANASQGAGLTYMWDFGGSAGSGATPTHTFTTTGAKTITLTVTDSLGFDDEDRITVTVVDASKFQWTSTFGAVAAGRVPLVITYDLRSNPDAAINGFVMDSIMWDPAVLAWDEIIYDCTCGGQETNPPRDPGVARTLRAIPFSANQTGLVQIATIWFDIVGDPGSSTTITTVFDESMNRIFGKIGDVNQQMLPLTEIVDGAFTVPAAQLGTVHGTITSSATLAGIPGVGITVTPAGGTALPVVTTDASGNYTVSDVPLGDGTGQITIALATLPADCQAATGNAGPFLYSGLMTGGTVVLDREMDCPPPPVEGYEFSATWVNPNPTVGTQATLKSVIDMSTFTDLSNSNDDGTLGNIDYRYSYNADVITPVNPGQVCVATDPFAGWTVIANRVEEAQGGFTVRMTLFTTSGNANNPKPLADCRFNVIAAGTSSQVYTFTALSNAGSGPLDPAKVVVTANEDLTAN